MKRRRRIRRRIRRAWTAFKSDPTSLSLEAAVDMALVELNVAALREKERRWASPPQIPNVIAALENAKP